MTLACILCFSSSGATFNSFFLTIYLSSIALYFSFFLISSRYFRSKMLYVSVNLVLLVLLFFSARVLSLHFLFLVWFEAYFSSHKDGTSSLIPLHSQSSKKDYSAKHLLSSHIHFLCSLTLIIIIVIANILVIFAYILIHHAFRITFISSSVSHPFILIILSWSHNLCSVSFKCSFSFPMLCIRFLYPLFGFPSS